MLKQTLKRIFSTSSTALHNALFLYPLSSLVLIWLCVLINLDIWLDLYVDKGEWSVFVASFALMIESIRIRTRYFINLVWRILLLVVVAVAMLFVSNELAGEPKKLVFFGSIVICFTLFIALNLHYVDDSINWLKSLMKPQMSLENERRQFFYLLRFLSVVFGFFMLFALLVAIFFGSAGFLFGVGDDKFIFQFIGTIISLLALVCILVYVGEVGYRCKECITPPLFEVRYISLILNVFAYMYAGLLIAYFGLYFMGGLIDVVIIRKPDSVVHLVLWFSLFGVVLVWLNDGVGKDYKKRLFLSFLLGLGIIALYSIIVRIMQYGITPNRYFVLAICSLLLIVIPYMFGAYRIWYILLGFCVMLGVGTLSPYNAIDVSIASQKARYIKASYQEQKNIDWFLSRYDKHYEKSSAVLKHRYEKPKTEEFEYRVRNLHLYRGNDEIIGVSGFDEMLLMWIDYDSDNSKKWNVGKYRFELDRGDCCGYLKHLKIYEGDEQILYIDNITETLKMIDDTGNINITQNGRTFRFMIVSIGGVRPYYHKNRDKPLKDAMHTRGISAILLIKNP